MAVPATTLSSFATATAVTNTQWYSTVVVENASNAALFVRLDGSAATATGTGSECVPAGTTATFPNQQPLPNSNGNGGNPLKFGWTDQNNNSVYGTAPTYVSVIGSGTGTVTVSLQ